MTDEILCGLRAGEFVPAFLPEVNPVTGEVIGFEVLARWMHPTRGFLSPADFLDAADEAQVVDQIDAAIFETTMEVCAEAFDGQPNWPNLSFNVCHARVLDADLSENIARWSYPGEIALELVESAFLEDESIGFCAAWKNCVRPGSN